MLPEIFPLFHEKYPNIELELLEGRSIQMRSALMWTCQEKCSQQTRNILN